MRNLKRSPILLTALFLVFSINGQTVTGLEPKKDREARELSGPVHLVKIERESIYSAPGEKPIDGGWIPSLTTYDRAGNVAEFVAYDEKGHVDYTSTSEFDSSGNKIIEKYFNADQTLKYTLMWKYDEDGNQIGYKDVLPDGFVSTWMKFTFDKAGRIISHSSLNSEGVILAVTEASFDKKGRLLNESWSGANTGRNVHRYSDDGKTEELETFDAKGDLEDRYVSSDDEKNDHTEETYDGTGKLLDKQTYEYTRDANGNWVTEICSEWLLEDDKMILLRKVKTTRTITYY